MTFEYNITYRKKDGGWQYIISFKDDTGKWRQRSKQGFNTKSLAKIAADKRLDELKEEQIIQINTEYEEITFEEFSNIYVSHKKLYSEQGTIDSLTCAIKHFSDLNNIKMNDIKAYHIQNSIDIMVKKRLEPSTIKKYLTHIKTLFYTAMNQYNIIYNNPVQNILIPSDKRQDKIKALTKIELEDLLNKTRSNIRYYLASLMASKCGLRVGEMVGLTWDRIDIKNATITVDRQWKKLKTGEWGFGPVKSKNSNRTIPAPAIVINTLSVYKNEHPIHISNRILPYSSSTALSSVLSRHFSKIGYDITIHDLRHTYATTLIANGIDPKTVAKLLGHDVDQTLKTYSHVNLDMMENATRIINNIF